MYRLILGFGILLCLLSTAHAQEEGDFKWVNAETYRLYQEQEWDSLIAMGREAIRQDLDVIIVAIRKKNGEMSFNPSSQTLIESGDTLISLGKSDDLKKLASQLSSR